MLSLLDRQRKALTEPRPLPDLKPLAQITYAQKHQREVGFCGCLVLAGGQASRLKSPLPKALFPVSPFQQKPLLRLLCERARLDAKTLGKPLPIAILTSPFNHEAISHYLKENRFFGLEEELVDLITQRTLPFLSPQGEWVTDSQGKPLEGPDGNGSALALLYERGIYDKWEKLGITALQTHPIDNPLAAPFDKELIDVHAEQGNEVTLKAIERLSPEERVGILALSEGKVCVQEYSELPQDTSPFTFANIGVFSFSLSFVKKAAAVTLPWHLAKKEAPELSGTPLWKFETFLFDLLPYSEKTGVVIYPRDEVYAPLKNASGDKSLPTVQEALVREWRTASLAALL